MGWASYTYNFVATGTSTTLSFASQDPGAYGAALDNVVRQRGKAFLVQCFVDADKRAHVAAEHHVVEVGHDRAVHQSSPFLAFGKHA